MPETQGFKTRLTEFPPSPYGEIIIREEFEQTPYLNPADEAIASLMEWMGFNGEHKIEKQWVGNFELDREKSEQLLVTMGEKANNLIDKVLGTAFLRIKTANEGEEEIMKIHSPTKLIDISTKTSPKDITAITRIQQARLKLALMHILNGIRRGYNQPEVNAIAETINDLIRRSQYAQDGRIKEVFFDPSKETIKFHPLEKIKTKTARKGLQRGFKINLLRNLDGTLTEEQPVLYVSQGKEERSVALKCLNKNINHIAGGILDAERIRIEFPMGYLDNLDSSERDIILSQLAGFLQNLFGTNLITGEGYDSKRQGKPNPSSTKDGIHRINFITTYRPNVHPETIKKLAAQLQSFVLKNADIKELVQLRGAHNIIIPRRNNDILTRAQKKLDETIQEIQNISNAPLAERKRRKSEKARLRRKATKLDKFLNLVAQIESIIPRSYDIKIPIENPEKGITLIGEESINEMDEIPVEIQIVDHLPRKADKTDHDQYKANQNARIAKEELGFEELPNSNTNFVPTLQKTIQELAAIVISEHPKITNRTIHLKSLRGERIQKRRTLKQHAEILLAQILKKPENIPEIETTIAKTGQPIRDAILEVLDRELISSKEGHEEHYETLYKLADPQIN